MIGVYKITNTVDGKVYVGSTTIDFGWRWSNHKSALRKNKHCNIHLQRAWNKYGESAFTFEVLETGTSKDEIREKEVSWIKRLFGKKCYNATTQVAGRPGKFPKSVIYECVKDIVKDNVLSAGSVNNILQQRLGSKISEHTIRGVFRELDYSPSDIAMGRKPHPFRPELGLVKKGK